MALANEPVESAAAPSKRIIVPPPRAVMAKIPDVAMDTLAPITRNGVDIHAAIAPGLRALRGESVDDMGLPRPKRSRLPHFLADLKELDGIPIFKLKQRKRKKIYFGISFDGVLGFHGQLGN